MSDFYKGSGVCQALLLQTQTSSGSPESSVGEVEGAGSISGHIFSPVIYCYIIGDYTHTHIFIIFFCWISILCKAQCHEEIFSF